MAARSRALRKELEAVLARDGLAGLAAFGHVDPQTLLGPLFACLLSPVSLVRWRAVSAFGHTARRMWDKQPESLRVLMRRLMWHLNEESGTMGWGAAEVMGEICVSVEPIAREFHRILTSYIHDSDCQGNFLDHCQLRRGSYWGVARLAQVYPDLARQAAPDVILELQSPDAPTRGLCCLYLARIPAPLAKDGLTALVDDQKTFELYEDEVLSEPTVGAVARRALDALARAGA